MGMGKHRFSGESLVGEGHPLWGLSGSRKPPAILSSVPHRSPPPHLTWSQSLLGAERHVHQRSGLSSGCQILSSLAFPAVTRSRG